MAAIPKRVLDRFAKKLPEYQKILKAANDKDVNESDTVTIVTDILADVFGYDKYSELTREYCIRGTYCDLAIKVDGNLRFLIEAKAIGLDLKPLHLRQALDYGAREGIQWVILTNGITWQVNRIRFEQPVAYDIVCSFDIMSMSHRKQDDVDLLFLLCREAISTTAIEDFHDRQKFVNRFVVGLLLQEEPVLDVIRRELRRLSPGLRVENAEVKNILTAEVVKRDTLEGELAEAAKLRLKTAVKKAARKPRNAGPAAEASVPPAPLDPSPGQPRA